MTPRPLRLAGGYTGGNTAEGQDALLSLTTGRYNTAVGLDSLKSNTVGLFNTAVGAHALMNQTRARHSTAVGKDALMNSTGSGNTALGANAGLGVSTATNVIWFRHIRSEHRQQLLYRRHLLERSAYCRHRSGFGDHNQHRKTWPR